MIDSERIYKREDRNYFAYLKNIVESNIKIWIRIFKSFPILSKKETRLTLENLALARTIIIEMEKDAETYLLRGKSQKINTKMKKQKHLKLLSFSSGSTNLGT